MMMNSGSMSMSNGWKKGPWTVEEDTLLLRLVEQHGAHYWSVISAAIPGRSGKSCRLRWLNQLNPVVHHHPFTPEEDALIISSQARYGNKWSAIARLFPGRTDNSIKNHWNANLRKCRRRAAVAAAAAASAAVDGAIASSSRSTATHVPFNNMLQSGKNNLIVDVSVAQSMFEQRCMMSQGQSSAEPDISYTSANLVPNFNENTVTHGPTVEPTLSLSLSLGLPVLSATSNQATKQPMEANMGNIGDKAINNCSPSSSRVDGNAQLIAMIHQMVREEVQLQTSQLGLPLQGHHSWCQGSSPAVILFHSIGYHNPSLLMYFPQIQVVIFVHYHVFVSHLCEIQLILE
jgi:transcription factor MYB, plant